MAQHGPAHPVHDTAVLRIAGLRRRHGGQEVLAGVDLAVARGELVALVGASGAGKSTLLRCVMGLEAYQNGALTVLGRRPEAGHGRAALLFQGLNQPPRLSAGEWLMRSLDCSAARARELLARVGLAERFDALPAELGRGQQQRVAIARALGREPALLLCDDIASSADPELAGEVVAALRAQAHAGLAVLVATPDAGFAHRLADRVLLLRAGRLQAPAHAATAPRAPSRPGPWRAAPAR